MECAQSCLLCYSGCFAGRCAEVASIRFSESLLQLGFDGDLCGEWRNCTGAGKPECAARWGDPLLAGGTIDSEFSPVGTAESSPGRSPGLARATRSVP